MTPAAHALQHWLLTHGRHPRTMEALLDPLAEQLQKHTPVDRIWAGTRVLHPQAAAWLWVWEDGNPTFHRQLSYDRFARLRQADSLARRLERGAPFVRLKAGSPDIPGDSTDLFEQRGYTDLFGLTLHIRGEWAGAVTWATRAPHGFSDAHIDLFRAIMPAMSAAMEPLAADLVTGVLLRTYLGRDAGNRVHQGAIQRGDGTTQRAVVWFSDVRGFTRISATLERDDLLTLLNDCFERVVASVEAEGGQVLKFLGDGVLAVFPEMETETTTHPSDACAGALRAAQALQRQLDVLRPRRLEQGQPAIDMGIGLHWGDVSYGNIGAPCRLDFTVIGPAVNLAARVESLCSSLGETILVTDVFAKRHGGEWRGCGQHPVKGMAQPVAVFTPTQAAEHTP